MTKENNKKGKRKITYKTTALLLAITLAAGTYGGVKLNKWKNNEYVSNSINKTVYESNVLASNLAFDPNDPQEMIDRISDIYIDSYKEGYDLTIEQFLDFYVALNIEHIDSNTIAKLGLQNRTSDSIMDNFDIVSGKLIINNAKKINPDSAVSISDLIVDKKNSKKYGDLEKTIAYYNIKGTAEKKVIRNTLNNELSNTDIRKIELPNLYLYYALSLITKDELNRVPSLAKSNEMFGKTSNNLSCDPTILGLIRTEKKENLDEKLDRAAIITVKGSIINTNQYLSMEYIKSQIDKNFKEANPKREVKKNNVTPKKPVTPSNERITEEQKKNIITITDPNTEKKDTFIVEPMESGEWIDQKNEVKEKIAKENLIEVERVIAIKLAEPIGYSDGYNGNLRKLYPDVIPSEIQYLNEYVANWIKYYNKEYDRGLEDRKRDQNISYKKEILNNTKKFVTSITTTKKDNYKSPSGKVNVKSRV